MLIISHMWWNLWWSILDAVMSLLVIAVNTLLVLFVKKLHKHSVIFRSPQMFIDFRQQIGSLNFMCNLTSSKRNINACVIHPQSTVSTLYQFTYFIVSFFFLSVSSFWLLMYLFFPCQFNSFPCNLFVKTFFEKDCKFQFLQFLLCIYWWSGSRCILWMKATVRWWIKIPWFRVTQVTFPCLCFMLHCSCVSAMMIMLFTFPVLFFFCFSCVKRLLLYMFFF